MSVINSMLRDLDRRHAPLPLKTNVQPALAETRRISPQSAIVLCVLIVLVILSWSHQPIQNHEKTANQIPLPPGEGKGEGIKPIAALATSTSPASTPEKESLTQAVPKIEQEEKSSLTPAPLPAGEGKITQEIKAVAPAKPEKKPQVQSQSVSIAPLIKQEHKAENDTDAERYQLARSALAQNQPQRAYELLRDNPPPMANAVDYHAVLAAVEQQLGHYVDAGLRYQQLLLLDQNQASWWLGLALSLEGQQRNRDALAAYQRATALNSLPEAARDYAIARIGALNASTSSVKAE